MKDLSGKYAVVTGAGKGIGAAIAKRFLEENAAGVAILEWDYDLAVKTAKELDPTEKRAFAVKCDVSDPVQVKAAIDAVVDAFGCIDILVNNAGITRDHMFHKMTDDEWYAVINVNLNGAYNMCRSVVPMMRERQSGSIINVVSTGVMGNPGQANYTAAKAGLQGLTRTLAKELAPKNIRVNAIAPGHILTDMMAAVGQEKLDMIQQRIPMRRLGKPEEIASLAAFLSGEDASWITGQTIIASGGLQCS